VRENWYVPLSRKVGETADMVKMAVGQQDCRWRRTCETLLYSCLNRLREAPSSLHQSGSTFARPADKNNVHHRQPSICEIARDFPGSGLRLLTISHCLSRKWHLHFLRDPQIIYDLIAAVSGQTSSAVSRYIEVIWGIASINRSAISCSSLRMLSSSGTISLSSRTSAAAIREV
jgi:hypothetical protein